jgi:hypothetical protein
MKCGVNHTELYIKRPSLACTAEVMMKMKSIPASNISIRDIEAIAAIAIIVCLVVYDLFF